MSGETGAGGSPSHGAVRDPAAGAITIRCREDGPLVIDIPPGAEHAVRVVDHLGSAFPLPTHKKAVALCRCGQSAMRPFCDGSHRTVGFRAAEVAPP